MIAVTIGVIIFLRRRKRPREQPEIEPHQVPSAGKKDGIDRGAALVSIA
jgi:hypothetical protein